MTGSHQLKFDTPPQDDYPAELYRYDAVAEGAASFAAVTNAHLYTFREQGYLVIEQAFTQAEIEAALAGLLHLLAGKVAAFDGVQYEAHAQEKIDSLPAEQRQDYVRKLMSFAAHDVRLEALAQHPALQGVLRCLIGHDELVMFQDMALLKPPGGGREKPWHQDKAFFNLSATAPVVGVWIALDEAIADNGCMHVIPGSHREGPMLHFKRRDWQICDSDVAVARDVMVPLEPGGVLLFDGLIHHGTPANRSSSRRRALQFHYTSAAAEWGTLEERLALFGSEGKDAIC